MKLKRLDDSKLDISNLFDMQKLKKGVPMEDPFPTFGYSIVRK